VVDRTTPTSPIDINVPADRIRYRFGDASVELDDRLLDRLRAVCARVDTDDASLADAGRDWWPLAIVWATAGVVPARPAAVARPTDTAEVVAVLALCNEARVPVTPVAGRSGVCGASVPVFGGVSLDLCALSGVRDVDDSSLTVDVGAGNFGTDLEAELRSTYGVTLGHWPQSVELSTVGGWLACRSAGQYSNRYGKIEDMVIGLDVALADGRLVHTGGWPRAAVGPDLTQLFVGSEGTMGVITGSRPRVHPVPPEERRMAFGFNSFADGLDACRRMLRRGAAPAVLRLYDEAESARNFDGQDTCALIILDEGDPVLIDATTQVVAQECSAAQRLDPSLVERWLEHRNDVSELWPDATSLSTRSRSRPAGRRSARSTTTPCRASGPSTGRSPPLRTSRTHTATEPASTSPSQAGFRRRTISTGPRPTTPGPGARSWRPRWQRGVPSATTTG
jgi:alkyldihydroxyacetonephosphate synthase